MGRLLPLLGLGLGLLSAVSVRAELVALQDSELSAVQGAGIGVVLEQVMMDASNATITINDITNGNFGSGGVNVPISVKEFYLGATGSNKGASLNPVNIGRLTQPFTLSLDKGEQINTLSEGWALGSKVVKVAGVNTTVYFWAPTGAQQWIKTTPDGVAVLGLNFPERLPSGGGACVSGFSGAGTNCSSRATEKVDMGIRFDFAVIPNGRTDVLNIDVTQLAMDGSYLRLWGDTNRKQLVGEAQLNVFAKTLDIMTCDPSKTSCNTPTLQAERSIYLTNVYANLAFGYGKYQPLLFDVSSDGQFVLELPNPVLAAGVNPLAPGAGAVDTRSGAGLTKAADFYRDAPRSTLVIDNLKTGSGVVATGGYNFGRNEISGMSFNYLKVTSYDLPQSPKLPTLP